jgi:hypothetical protein
MRNRETLSRILLGVRTQSNNNNKKMEANEEKQSR